MLYADDLAIVSDSIEDLNKMLEAAGLWAAESQTEFNFGKGKTEFVCYGAEKKGLSGEARILGRAIKEVDLYRYLGVDLHRELGFNGNLSMEEMNLKPKTRKQEGLQRAKSGGAGGQGLSFFPYISTCARKMMNKRGICNTMGMRGGGFSTEICKKLMSTFVLSQAQYSIPVWGMDSVKDTQLEKAQIESAKNILGLEEAVVSYDVVRNELGLLAMSRRRMIAELVYYWKVVHMPVGRQQRKFVKFLEGDGTGSGSSRNWLVEHMKPVIKSWALPDPGKVRKLEDWRLLVRRKANDEEVKTLEDGREKSSAKEYCYDYLGIRNGCKRTMPSYLRGWENVGRLKGRIVLTNIRLRTLPLGCRRGWAGSKACPLCDILRKPGASVVEEDELHVFAGECPMLRSVEVYGDFRNLITGILVANKETYIFDVKRETMFDEENLEPEEACLGIKWNEQLFLELIRDKRGDLISERSWGRCQAVFQQFLFNTWNMRKSILEEGNSERLVAACQAMVGEDEEEGMWSGDLFDAARRIVDDPIEAKKYRERQDDEKREQVKRTRTTRRRSAKRKRSVSKQAKRNKQKLIGKIIRGDGGSGIVLGENREGKFTVAMEPWGKDVQILSQEEVIARATKDYVDEIPDFGKLGEKIWVKVGAGLGRIQGVVKSYCLDEQTYEICFDSEVEWTWERDVNRAAKGVGQSCKSWWVNGVELTSIMDKNRELTPAAIQFSGSLRQGEAS